jgi:hypothetical protein
MDLPTTLLVLLVGAAIIGLFDSARDGRGLDAFGQAFVGYRSYGWPRGVQEEDEVRFSFTETRDPLAVDDVPAGPDDIPELIELAGTPVEAIPLERLRRPRSLAPGRARGRIHAIRR